MTTLSVIIPVHNGERYLAEAIESVRAQRHPALELIVVDDASTDRSLLVAEQASVSRVVRRERRGGAGAARNSGVASAAGDLLAFLDSDDLWTEGRLSRQLDAIAADPALDAVFGQVREFVSRDLDAAAARRLACRSEPRPGYLPSALVIRRAAFDRVGAFREDLDIGEFVDWMARARERGLRHVVLEQTVMLRRLHSDNQSLRQRRSNADFARVAKAALDRRRRDSQAEPA